MPHRTLETTVPSLCSSLTRRHLLITIALAAVGTGMPAAAGNHDKHTAPASGGTPDASPMASPAAGSTVEMTIDNIAFSPAEITILSGTTVRWTNREKVQHTVRSKEELFDSGILEQGDTFEYRFGDEGAFDYICALHPSMKGLVTVTGNATPGVTPDASPSPAT